jgi:ABC-type transport system substrate-binding protein
LLIREGASIKAVQPDRRVVPVPYAPAPVLRDQGPIGRPGTARPIKASTCCWSLGTHPKAGAIADVRVRRAVNYAIDKVAYRDAIAGRYPATGELASTILARGSLGYRPYDLSPTPGGRGDLWERSLQLPAKRLEHQLGQSVWRPD